MFKRNIDSSLHSFIECGNTRYQLVPGFPVFLPFNRFISYPNSAKSPKHGSSGKTSFRASVISMAVRKVAFF